MNKVALTLLASSGLLGALLLIVNPAHAGVIVSPATDSAFVSVQSTHVRSQNPTVTFNQRKGNPILDNLGCSCATCTTVRRQDLQGKLPF
ncbi:hypothetical protein [Aerosakkonema funiforme]|uniref:Uncharacterized protein n=1 Tax=Aerosakkonema funiforme FACHB-1375 TaxID=2949571 RepID=A0A926VIZ2_9CYAN|nr:hypothetical protein [Aerosakkonema funiforme]MBD2184038.1 hypothetical protein [Aerosakkonema funiforme FACHB-1375]